MERIISRYLEIKDKLKIYIYDYYPSGFTGIKQFIEKVIKTKATSGFETYNSWLYFIDYVLHSSMYTTDPSIADYFLVPQWENLHLGRNYYNDLILPLKNATESEYYKKTSPKRNHIFIYISDDTPLSENRIPQLLRNELKERFIRLSYSGRIRGFGKFHNGRQSDSIFNYDASHEIVVPPGVPLKYDYANISTSNSGSDILYIGTLNPSREQSERVDSLNYMKNNFHITDKAENSLFGIHCAGFGIWTARFYNYLKQGIIPILFSDGVIMPFESFFNYKSFSLKILGSSCDSNNQQIVNELKNAMNIYRKYSKGNNLEITTDEKTVYKRLVKIKNNIRKISQWFDWRSQHPYKNPYTLITIELDNRLNNTYSHPVNPIAKEEYYDLNSENVSLYREV